LEAGWVAAGILSELIGWVSFELGWHIEQSEQASVIKRAPILIVMSISKMKFH
jgi:hypothetical protein